MEEQNRLESWKEIGAYLQRDARTARRWETEEGLPVHRHGHRRGSSVYAFPSEIDEWRVGRKVTPEPPPPRPLWKIPAFALTMLLCLVMVGNGVRPVAAQQARGLGKRLLCDNCVYADLSPDGHKMVFVENRNNLAIRDMATERVSLLPSDPSGPKDSRLPYPEFLVFSPDLKLVVYHATIYDGKGGWLRIAATEKGKAGIVSKPCYCYPQAWFPDGRSILVIRFQFDLDSTWQLARVSVPDGTITPIKSLDWRWITSGRASLSPDGKYVAYSALAVNPKQPLPGPGDRANQHVWVLAVDGSREREIVRTSGVNRSPVWTPDGSHVLYVSDATGKLDLWSLEIRNGKETGTPVRIMPDIGDIEPLSVHGESYYYRNLQPGNDYVSIMDSTKPSEDSKERIIGTQASWSPDGKSIAFKRPHPVVTTSPGGSRNYDLVVHSLETGEERLYQTSLGPMNRVSPIWFHDSKNILAELYGPNGRAQYKVELRTGVFTKLPDLPELGLPGIGVYAQLSSDDRAIFSVVPGDRAKNTSAGIISIDLMTGLEREILAVAWRGIKPIALSPDGRTLAFLKGVTGSFQVCTVSVDGSNFRELSSTDVSDIGVGGGSWIAWSKDGRSIFYNLHQSPEASWDLMRLPADGSAPASVALTGLSSTPLDISPDGSKFLVNVHEDLRTEVWALDHVLSTLK